MITKKILDGLKADISLITTANGYNINLVKCHNVEKQLDKLQADEFDSFYLRGGSARSEETEGGLLRWTWVVGAEFYLSVDNDPSGGLLSVKNEKLKADIVTLYKNWMSNANGVTLNDVEELESCYPYMFDPYFDDGATKGTFLVFFEITYIE